MLEPYIRMPLEIIEKTKGVYSANFRTPQRLGIFKFYVEYMRHGLSYINLDDEVSII